MPLTVVCSSCRSRLSVPDRVAGKKVKCPKCQAMVPVPAPEVLEEVEELEEVAERPKAAIKAVRPASAQTGGARRPMRDDDEEEDRPRKRQSVLEEAEVDEEAELDEEADEDRPRKRKSAHAEDDETEDDRPRKRKPV